MDVSLKNAPLELYGFLQGNYLLTANVNGKPSWTTMSGGSSIWYSHGTKRWMIGYEDYIGTDTNAIITAVYNYEGVDNISIQWYYKGIQATKWTKASRNDISIQCIGELKCTWNQNV